MGKHGSTTVTGRAKEKRCAVDYSAEHISRLFISDILQKTNIAASQIYQIIVAKGICTRLRDMQHFGSVQTELEHI